jgi:hypothetical protein
MLPASLSLISLVNSLNIVRVLIVNGTKESDKTKLSVSVSPRISSSFSATFPHTKKSGMNEWIGMDNVIK